MYKVLVSGAGGFIGTHLVRKLKERGYWVRGVDLKRPKWSKSPADEFWLMDLRNPADALAAVMGMKWVFALAADMGGAGYVFTGKNDWNIMYNNSLINLNTLEAARRAGVTRLLFSSSACIYPEYLQDEPNSDPLRESDAYPFYPDSNYGWEKLYTERLCAVCEEISDIEMRIVRFHNVYGPETEWRGGREKAPAAMCRKVAAAKLAGNSRVEIWGDGQQSRSFMYIDDCTDGILHLMNSDYDQPLNLGRDRMVTINQLVDIVAAIAGVEVEKVYVPGPRGVMSRNSDNALCKEVLGWVPTTPLETGLVPTFEWIESQVKNER